MSETEPKKRGFFSRLFGREEEQAAPGLASEPVIERIVEPIEESKPDVEEVAPTTAVEAEALVVDAPAPEPVAPPVPVEEVTPVEPEPEAVAIVVSPSEPVAAPEPAPIPVPPPKRSWTPRSRK